MNVHYDRTKEATDHIIHGSKNTSEGTNAKHENSTFLLSGAGAQASAGQ